MNKLMIVKKIVCIILLKSIISSTAIVANEQAPVANNDKSSIKIAVIKSNSLENCLYFKDLKKKWEKEFSPRIEQIQIKQKDFDSKKDLFQRDKAILSDKERIAKERDLTKLQQDLQHMYETLDSEAKSKQQEDMLNFNKFVDQVVANFAKQEQYDIILSDQSVLFNQEKLDCTNKLIEVLDNRFKSKKH